MKEEPNTKTEAVEATAQTQFKSRIEFEKLAKLTQDIITNSGFDMAKGIIDSSNNQSP